MKDLYLYLIIIFLGVVIISVTSCKENKSNSDSDIEEETMEYLMVSGTGESSNMRASIDMSFTRALSAATLLIDQHANILTEKFIAEADINDPDIIEKTTQITRTVASHRFQNINITSQETLVNHDGRYITTTEISIPKSEIKRELINRYKTDEDLFEVFNRSSAFQEINKVLSEIVDE